MAVQYTVNKTIFMITDAELRNMTNAEIIRHTKFADDLLIAELAKRLGRLSLVAEMDEE